MLVGVGSTVNPGTTVERPDSVRIRSPRPADRLRSKRGSALSHERVSRMLHTFRLDRAGSTHAAETFGEGAELDGIRVLLVAEGLD